MPKYSEVSETTEVVRYRAMSQAVISNPRDGTPDITFHEVERLVINDELISEIPTGRTLVIRLDDPNAVIPYCDENYNPVFDENGDTIIGFRFTKQQFAGMVASAYIKAAYDADQSAASA